MISLTRREKILEGVNHGKQSKSFDGRIADHKRGVYGGVVMNKQYFVGDVIKNNEGRKFLITKIGVAGLAKESEKVLAYVKKADYTLDVVYGTEIKKIVTPQVPALEGMTPLGMKITKTASKGVTCFELKF